MNKKELKQENIRLGTHGEDYGSWMSNPVFYIIGGIGVLTTVLAVLSFYVFRVAVLGILFAVITIALVALLIWITWIRRQYAFGGGGIMEQGHRVVLSHLDYDSDGKILEVGCGSGALAIRAALTWPKAKVIGVDYWGTVYNYSKVLCEKNAASEGVASHCVFRHGDMEGFAQKLRDMGYQDVRLVDTAQEVFGSHRRAAMMMLGSSRLLVGRK